MHNGVWLTALVVLLSGCTDQAAPGAEPLDAGDGPAATQGGTAGFDAANFTKQKEGVYAFQDLLAGASPGSAHFEDHYEALLPARQDTFEVAEGVWKLGFSAGMGCGTGSGRVLVHGPDGERVYASHAWNLVGAPSAACVVVEEQNEQKGGPFVSGEYTVTYYVAGAMVLGLEVEATYLVPNEASEG